MEASGPAQVKAWFIDGSGHLESVGSALTWGWATPDSGVMVWSGCTTPGAPAEPRIWRLWQIEPRFCQWWGSSRSETLFIVKSLWKESDEQGGLIESFAINGSSAILSVTPAFTSKRLTSRGYPRWKIGLLRVGSHSPTRITTYHNISAAVFATLAWGDL